MRFISKRLSHSKVPIRQTRNALQTMVSECVSVNHGDLLCVPIVVVAVSDCCGCNFRYGVSADHDDSLCLIVVVVISDTVCLWVTDTWRRTSPTSGM